MKTRAVTSLPLIAIVVLALAGCAEQGRSKTADNEAIAVSEPAFDPGALNPAAPLETAQFGQLAGVWDIADESLQADGTWAADRGAEWIWYYVLDGHAIQDDWIAPSRDQPTDDTPRQFGTNLRIYNPQKKQWELAWLSNTDQRVSTFTATYEDSTLIMRNAPDSSSPTRITFFDITEKTFEWKLEVMREGAWTEIYRIHAVRRLY